MQTDFLSLLPFLRALQRQTGAPQDDDDSDPQSGALVEPQVETQAGAPAVQTRGNALLQLLQSGLNSGAQSGDATQSGDPNQTQTASGGQNGGAGGQDPVSPAGPQVDLAQARQQTQNKQTQNQPTQPLLGQLPGVSDSITPEVLDLSLGLAGPPRLAVPTLSIKTAGGGPGSGLPTWDTLFQLDSPSDAAVGGFIVQKIIPSSTVEQPYWEAWRVQPGQQYTDFALEHGKVSDDAWSHSGVRAEARYYDGLAELPKGVFKNPGEINYPMQAIKQPATYDDPTRSLPSDRVSDPVSRSFP